MEQWVKISLLLCVFGFLKAILPSGPFTYDFMTGPWRNVTHDEVTKKVFPLAIYSYMTVLIFVFLITDMCRYKPVIVVLNLSGVVNWAILLWTTNISYLKFTQIFYGMFLGTEVAYYAYIYAKVDRKHYDEVSSYTRAAILAGRTISAVSSQVLVSLELMDFRQLNYISFTSLTAATIWALFLPSVDKSTYFHSEDVKDLPCTNRIVEAYTMMKSHFMDAFTNISVVKWCAWYALATCGYFQIETYIQPLYSVVQNADEDEYTGAVVAIVTFLSFLATLLAGCLKINWEIKGEVILGIISLVQGVLIGTMSQSDSLFLCYSCYILFGILFQFMMTIASAQIAKSINEDSFGLIFGLNTFIALVFGSILTAVVATEGIGFALDPRDQYIVYGCYHLAISLIFIFMGVRTVFFTRLKLQIQNK